MTNQEKRLAKDMYLNFARRYEWGLLRVNDLYERVIMQEIEAEKMKKEIKNLKRKLGEHKENERALLKVIRGILL